MRRKIFISVLSLVLALSFTACNKKEETNVGTVKNENASQKEDDKKVSENKEDKKVVNKNMEKVDDKLLKFTSKYLEEFDDNSYSCMVINFKNDDFIPDEIREKIKTIDISKYGKPDNGIEQGFKPYKSLVINFREGALYKISTTADKIEDLKFVKAAYLAKGDAILLENADKYYKVDIYSADEIDGVSNCYPFTTYNDESPEKMYSICRWTKRSQPSVFANDRMYTEKDGATRMTANVDLNGDDMKDIISIKALERKENLFGIDNSFFSLAKWKMLINDKEFDLMSFDKLKNFDDGEKNIRIYIDDIDKSDRYKEIFVDIAGNEHNIYTEVFRYDNGELTHIGTMEREQSISLSNNTKDGICLMPNRNYGLGFSYVYDKIYFIKDSKVVEDSQESKRIYLMDSAILGTLKVDLNLYENNKSDKKSDVLKKGEVIWLQETDDKSWIKVQSIETGKSGYLLLSRNSDDGSIKFKDQEVLKLESFEEAIDGIYDGEG